MMGRAVVKQEPDWRDWPKCGRDDCTGIRLHGHELCLAHVKDAVRAVFLADLKPGSDVDLRGIPIDSDLLAAVLEPLQEDGKSRLGSAQFSQAQFSGDARFVGAQFSGDARFDGARFSRNARFAGAQFSGNARFDEAQFSGYAGFDLAQFSGNAGFVAARFSGDAGFSQARFSGDAGFGGAQFSGDARLGGAQFSRSAGFAGAQFSGNAGFVDAQFGGDAAFGGAQFSGNAVFGRARFSRRASFVAARFSGDTEFYWAHFSGDAEFDEAQFSAARVLGPLIAETQFSLRQASFSAPIVIEAAARRFWLAGAAYQESASLRVRFAEIVLDGASFTKPSTISYAETAFRSQPDSVLETGMRGPRPRVLSLRLVDVSNLVLGNLDLSACLFQGAHNLESLRIEGPVGFSLTPGPWRARVGQWWVPIWRRWARRQTLAEEHHFRAGQSNAPRQHVADRPLRRQGWNPPDTEMTKWVAAATGQPVQGLAPENLAVLYRALRKGLEDQKNAPAASDFYYGEMEMRRIAPTSPWADRFVLWVYWLFSGYGLRASRAQLAFAILVPLFAIAFQFWGLDPDHGHPVNYPTALLRSLESATSLLRPSPPGLNQFGQLLDAVLRLIGATLLGLALFSLRGRIKR